MKTDIIENRLKRYRMDSPELDDPMKLAFSNVWFLESENAFGNFKFAAMDDVGALSCTDTEIVFKGKKKTSTIKNIKSLGFGKQGRDFINSWIKITYDDNEAPRSVYIADGRLLGWSGVLGGTKKMYGALSELLLNLSR